MSGFSNPAPPLHLPYQQRRSQEPLLLGSAASDAGEIAAPASGTFEFRDANTNALLLSGDYTDAGLIIVDDAGSLVASEQKKHQRAMSLFAEALQAQA